jgi:hypothetical protein
MTAGQPDPSDRELWAVLVALEPLDSRKWDYLDIERRMFHAEAMLEQGWSSGERVLIDVAQSLWNDGKVDLGYIACALGERHLQAVIDATAIRAGQPLASDTRASLRRVSSMIVRRGTPRAVTDRELGERNLSLDRPERSRGLEL